MKLSNLKIGQKFIVSKIEIDDVELLYRLEQLGFYIGKEGICQCKNFGGNSIAYRINGSVIALRKKEADKINCILKEENNEFYVMLAGNPNVGKSTLFNVLTGMRQHTGNWPGKTVEVAMGNYKFDGRNISLVDLPGTYSLRSRSEEEEVTSQAILSGKENLIINVCDACSLEKGLRFLFEIKNMQIKNDNKCPMILCVNLCDEAVRKGIKINFKLLEELTGYKVIQTSASSKKGIKELKEAINLEYDKNINVFNNECISFDMVNDTDFDNSTDDMINDTDFDNITDDKVNDTDFDNSTDENKIVHINSHVEQIVEKTVDITEKNYWKRDWKIDKFLTSPFTGTLTMISLLFVLFFITLKGANYPSEILSYVFTWIGIKISAFLYSINVYDGVIKFLIDGVWKTAAWVVSVMLPPMAIFFPLFTIIEDLGYLPRVAFLLDGCFRRCGSCGKQALTMCMGLGCNAVGVSGCRIIESKTERIIAILTNSFIPCNGRFPTIIALITMFFAGKSAVKGGAVFCIIIVAAAFSTFFATKVLSKIIKKDNNTAFILELPPYRKPQVAQVIIRSVLERTLFVLGRAITAAVPAGMIIWLLANVNISLGNDAVSLLSIFTSLLEKPGRFIGLDGTILLGFIIGFPANEIVIPSILMGYLNQTSLVAVPDFEQLRQLFISFGWTMQTAICMLIFTMFHWPCATTCMTIYKETKSFKWTAVSFLVPAMFGIILCVIVRVVIN